MRLALGCAASAALVTLAGTSVNAWAANPCVGAASDAQDLRATGKLRQARMQLLVCSAATCNAVVRASCVKWLAEVDEQQPTLIVRAMGPRGRELSDAQVLVDEKPVTTGEAIAIDPGWHTLQANADGRSAEPKRILVGLGEKGRVVELRFPDPASAEPAREIDTAPATPPPPAPEPEPRRSVAVPLVLGGLGVLALGSFGYFEIVGHSDYDDLANGCFKTKSCKSSDEAPVKAEFVAAYVSVGVAAVALAAAAIVYLTSGPSRSP